MVTLFDVFSKYPYISLCKGEMTQRKVYAHFNILPRKLLRLLFGKKKTKLKLKNSERGTGMEVVMPLPNFKDNGKDSFNTIMVEGVMEELPLCSNGFNTLYLCCLALC